MSLLASKIIELARKEVGVEEIDGTNCGPRVNEYKAATWLPADKGWAWCAAFVCWLIREAMAQTGIKETARFKRPQTASAWGFENWSLEQDGTTRTKKPHRGDILPGDIVIFKFSHIGIATSAPDAEGFVHTIEGNTDSDGSREGGAVLEKRRHASRIRSRIRFTV
jgi:hypothetical protein